MADFEVDVCPRAVWFLKDQDLVKAITKVPQNIPRCWQLLKHLAKGWNSEFYSQQGCFGGFANGIREIVVSSTNSWTLCSTTQCSSARCTRRARTEFWTRIFTLCSFSFPTDSFCNNFSLNLRLLWQSRRIFRSVGSTFVLQRIRGPTDRLSSSIVKSVEILSKTFSSWAFPMQGCNIHHYTQH